MRVTTPCYGRYKSGSPKRKDEQKREGTKKEKHQKTNSDNKGRSVPWWRGIEEQMKEGNERHRE